MTISKKTPTKTKLLTIKDNPPHNSKLDTKFMVANTFWIIIYSDVNLNCHPFLLLTSFSI